MADVSPAAAKATTDVSQVRRSIGLTRRAGVCPSALAVLVLVELVTSGVSGGLNDGFSVGVRQLCGG
jgi:bacterioferritin-associated ferredoxin